MSKKTMKPVAAAIGAAFVGSMMLAGGANAASNPFGLTELNGGYAQIASSHGEGKCGGSKAAEKTMEGKCGAGKCGGSKAAEKTMEGKCGAGKCGGSKAAEKTMEGKCGGSKAAEKTMEGKCGAGKCGGAK